MLQGRPHLDLEPAVVQAGELLVGIERLGDPADIVERHIAERVDRQQLALVHRVVPVHFEQAVHQGGNLIDLIVVERDDARAHNVGDIVDRLVFLSFQLQLAGQAFFLLDAGFQAGYDQMTPFQAAFELLEHDLPEPVVHRQVLPVFLQDHRAVQVQAVFVDFLSHCVS